MVGVTPAHVGHLGVERPGDLHGEGPFASRRPDDQDLLPRLDPPVVAQALQGGQAGDGDHRRLLEGQVCWSGCELVLASARVLGEGALADAEHLIARLEPGSRKTDLLEGGLFRETHLPVLWPSPGHPEAMKTTPRPDFHTSP